MHSAYDGAVNLKLGNRLCTLAPSRIPDGPATIRVADPEWPKLAGASRGDPVALRAARLRVGATVIDLRTARVWHPADPPEAIASGALAAAAAARDQAIQRGGATWIPDLVRQAVTGRDRAEAVRGLIGRGVGLTPSGDDALVGALAACWVVARSDPGAAQTHTDLAEGVLAGLDQTNDLSASFLEMAAAGQFQDSLWRAGLAVVGGAKPGAKLRLLSMGATSGADCALGLTTALETIIDRSNGVAA